MEKAGSVAVVSPMLFILVISSVTAALVIIPLPSSAAPLNSAAAAGGSLNGQSYSGELIGNPIYVNNSFPFETYAISSTILSLPAMSSWLASHDYSVTDLRPYSTLYPSEGNPYDFPQASGIQNGTAFSIFEYTVVHSPVGLVIGAWVAMSGNQLTQTVLKIFTYDTAGPGVVSESAYSAGAPSSPAASNGVEPLNTGHNNNSFRGVGHQTEDTSLSKSSSMYGALYNTEVFSDLASPSSCGSECWTWSDWIGASNYSWISSTPPEYFYFFQAVVQYWGGTLSEPANCGGSFSYNCEFFQYDIDNGSYLSTYAPGYGGWTAGNTVTLKWIYLTENCKGSGYNQVNVVQETIDDVSTGTSVSYTKCMPNITYTEFLEERSQVGSDLTQNPKFGTHDFTASLIDGDKKDIPVNSGSNTWLITLVDEEEANLVTCTQLNNGATSSSWSSTWVASTYP